MLNKYIVYSQLFVFKRGMRDGRTWEWQWGWPLKRRIEPYPSDKQTQPAEFEEELYRAADSKLAEKSEKWSEKDLNLRQACKQAENEYLDASQKLGSLTAEHQQQIKKCTAAQKRYDALAIPHYPSTYFWGLAVVLFICELALNQVVFDIFLAPRWETILMAVGVVVCITAVAKFQGSYLQRENKTRTDYLFIVGGFLFAITVLVLLSWLRRHFVEALGVEQVLGITVNPTGMMMFFLSINAIFYFTCLWSAYATTPKQTDEFKAAERHLRNCRRELSSTRKNFNSIQYLRARNRFDQAHVTRTRSFDEFSQGARVIVGAWATLVRAYRDGNVQARRSGGYEPPKYFALVSPTERITIPPSLCTIDCSDCTHPSLTGNNGNSSPPNDTGLPIKEANHVSPDNTLSGVPVLLTEITDPTKAKALFQTFREHAGLETAMAQVEENTGISHNQLCFHLEGYRNPRQVKLPSDNSQAEVPWWNFVSRWQGQQQSDRLRQTWMAAWLKLASRWHDIDLRLLSASLTSRHYHLYPHLALPLAFAAGAAIGLRRSLTIYHGQAHRYFPVLNLPDPRELFSAPAAATPAPEKVVGNAQISVGDRLILHILVSDQHAVNFEAHVNWRSAQNKAIVYKFALPEQDWREYLKHLVHETKKLLPLYKSVELCLVCPAALSFALGMAFAWDTNITVCQYDGQNYFPVLSLQELKKHRMFT